jgi:hypothetical protein
MNGILFSYPAETKRDLPRDKKRIALAVLFLFLKGIAVLLVVFIQGRI